MGYYYKRKFYTRIYSFEDGTWSFGIGLSHSEDEIFLYFDFYRWRINVGYFYECEIRR